MLSPQILFLLCTIASLVLANPCAEVSALYLTSPDLRPRVPAELAMQCLQDVDFDTSAASPWLDSIEPYIQWQTTTAYLKDPPQGYLMPSIDIWGKFREIRKRAESENGYLNEYDFGRDVYKVFQKTYDGHFRYIPNILTIFLFGRPISLISNSVDGIQTPKVYVYNDVLSNLVNGSTKWFSAVQNIDGRDACDFLEDWSMHGTLQDPDALYNNVFFSLAQASLESFGTGPGTFAGAGRGGYVYPGPNTTITFENGTTRVFDNFARVAVPFGNIKNGSALYKEWLNPDLDSDFEAKFKLMSRKGTDDDSADEDILAPPGYPTPVALAEENLVGGYYLDQPGYEDVAVLAVASFMSGFGSNSQNITYDFLDKAREDGKTKLIIDLSANGGGSIMEGYSTFLNLFPGLLPYGATRLRNHEAFDLMGETVSEREFYYPFDVENAPNPLWGEFIGTPFNYRSDVNIDYKNFHSWREKNPLDNQFAGDNFTAIIRWNLSDPTVYDSARVQINGYGSRVGLPPARPFDPENIVLLYDGYCASTCTIFSELMTQQIGKTKTVSIGGRSNNKPMQTIGGTKGTNNWGWLNIHAMIRDTYELASDQAGFFNASTLYDYIKPTTSLIPFRRGQYNAGVNVRDGIRYGDKTQTPLQFVYDAADCRLFYTAEMTVDVSTIWEKVADVAWDGDECAVGGFRTPKPVVRGRKLVGEVRWAYKKALKKRRTYMASHVAAIERTLDVLHNDLQPQPGLMLP